MANSLIGKQIGQYEVIEAIGHGGMADVYRAHQPSMKRDVAIKVLASALARSEDFRARFDREVEMIASLEHAHTLPVYDHGALEDGALYLVMRYIKGGSLADQIVERGALPLATINTYLQQIASALDYAHQKGIVHRDIKPGNVLIDTQGDVFLADFGLAYLGELGKQSNLTRSGALVGTPTYIAPEQALTSKGDARSDIYSLGVVLYEMVTGKPPFTGDSMFTIMQAHVSQLVPMASKFRPDLPNAVQAVLERAMAKDPDVRYQTASEVARDFSLAIQGQLVTMPRIFTNPMSSSVLRALGRGNPRTGVFALGMLTVILVALGLVVVPRLMPNGSNSVTMPQIAPFVAEDARPVQGKPEDIALSSTELEAASLRLKDGFIGVMACSLKTEWHASFARGARTRVSSYGFQVKVEDSQEDRFRQPAIINQFIAEGAKAIIACPLDEQQLTEPIRAAQEAGIVVMVAGDTAYGKLSASFTLTNETMGGKVGEFAAELINQELGGEARVIILDYPDLPSIVARADAMEKALLAGAPKAKILARYLGGLPDNGEQSMTVALQEHPDINLIMSINDAGAFGAIKALRAAGKGFGDVLVVGVDAESEARRMMLAGEFFRGSVENDPVGVSSLAVDSAIKMLGGGVVPRQILLPGRMVTKAVLEALTPTPAP